MAKYFHPDVLDGGLLAIKNGATQMLLINNYTLGDSYATVVAAKVAAATMTSADFTLATSGNNRTLTTTAKSGVAATANSSAGDHHIAWTDGSAKVLAVTDETGEAVVTSGGTVNFPAIVMTKTQPT